jgi:RNase adapter protein RapZ
VTNVIALKLIIITGLSGSGKSTALAAFEDAGFYCVDNMPVALLPKFLELPLERSSDFPGLAFVMDLREKGFLSKYPSIFKKIRQNGLDLKVIFAEAREEIILQRFSQTRRQHPLSRADNLMESVRAEQQQLEPLKIEADKIIDTSDFTVHDLKAAIMEIARKDATFSSMRIQVLSFGYKYGIPRDADIIMDVRFLTNPYFVPDLKHLTGESEKVTEFILNDGNTKQFMNKYLDLLDYLIPLYEKEGKAYLTIAIGCTGGKHRSVVIARVIHKHIGKVRQFRSGLAHRELE